MSTPAHVRIFDTTLRDGEQSPGCSMSPQQKAVMARALAELGVDIIETGFPASSQSDREAAALIARDLRETTLCVLSRCLPGDIEASARALEAARQTAPARVPVHQPAASRAQIADEQGRGAGSDGAQRGLRAQLRRRRRILRPKTAPAPKRISWPKSSPPRSRPARRPSTCPIRSATPRRPRCAACSSA